MVNYIWNWFLFLKNILFNFFKSELDPNFIDNCNIFFKKIIDNINIEEKNTRSNMIKTGENLFELFKVKYIQKISSLNNPNGSNIR